MSIICVDIESFYDKTFSLSKLTTESYIRSPLFETIGFAYSIDGAPATWVTGTEAVITAALHELDLPEHTVVCHNAAFDGAILAWRYGIIPKNLLCTMAMAKPVHGHTKVGGSLAKLVQHYELGVKGTEVVDALGKRRRDFDMSDLHQYGQYCKNDVMLTWALFNKLLPFTTKRELYIIDMLLKMYVDPVLEFDKPLLETHLNLVREKKQLLMDRLDAIGRAELMSNQKFAGILEKLGVVPPVKVSPATGKSAYAFAKTDAAFKALLEHEDMRVQTVVAARLGVKSTLEETRTEAFIGIAERGKLPVMLQYYGAATGRCLTGDTKIVVFRDLETQEIRLDELRASDLVWDGDDFVEHDGLISQGLREVISYDGITGTPDHEVFTQAGSCSLSEAMRRGLRLTCAGSPKEFALDTAYELASPD